MKPISIGGVLLDAGKITAADAEKILRLQKEQGLRFGDAGKALNLLTEEDIQQSLSQQFDFPFLTDADSSLSHELIAAFQPFCPQVEVLRAIRSQLMVRWFNDQRKALAIVSPDKGEGRSYFTANLAVVFSQLGERTLLVDANLRQPRQHVLFNIDKKQGLSDVLADRADLSVITKIAGLKGLSVLPAGTIPPNPQELISRGLDNYLKQFSQDYDVILVDTPSSSQGSDAQVIATKTVGALLLARQHKSRLKALEALKGLLIGFGVACVGAVISDF